MEIKSLGLQSDLLFYQNSSVITDRENYLKIETTNNPNYFWGNLLIFPNPPSIEDFEIWTELFKKEFSINKEIKHMTFTWDIFGQKGQTKKFEDAGFTLDEIIVLVATSLKLQSTNEDIKCRKIISSQDWHKVIELQIQIGIETEKYIEEKYRPFVIKRFDEYRALSDKGLGNWYGAFNGDELVCDLGLFGNAEFARFQSIETHLQFRKKSIAQTLMKFATDQQPSKKYLLHAVSEGPAIDMYMRIGFEIKEVITGLCLYNIAEWKHKTP